MISLTSSFNATLIGDWLTTFDTFKKYMEKEMEILSSDDEEALTKELELFETIHQIIKEKQRKR